jgi:hypothetical protein
MSTCDITSGFTLGCRDNTGGIRAIYILSGSISNITTNATGSVDGVVDETITGITGSGVWYKFELFRQTSNYAEEITSTPENGTIFYNQNLNAVFFKMKQAVRNQVNTLAKNPNLRIIVQTNNGTVDGSGAFFLMGQENGAQLLSGTGQTGTAFGDLNGYNLTFNGQEPFPASEVLAQGVGDPTQVDTFSGSLAPGMSINYGPF